MNLLQPLTLLFSLITLCNLASIDPSLSAIVIETTLGKINGTRRTVPLELGPDSISTIDEILGIPYAAPPVGNMRFRPPGKPYKWNENVRDGTRHGPVCPQNSSERRQKEDCLYLNIYTPYDKKNPRKKYPVMVFIHGGSYFYGTGNRYNGSALAQFGVVFVSINYRLGALGFMTNGSPTFGGNYGLLDQVAALQWLQENIAAFRGDPDAVTIFGSSAGGASVGLLLLSPLTTGLFHRVIAQSGTANALWATHLTDHSLRSSVRQFAHVHDCYQNDEQDDELIKCLQTVPFDKFKGNHVCQILTCTEVDPLFKPRVDGYLLPESPIALLKKKAFPSMPYMTGTVRAEFGDYYGEEFSKEMLEYEVDAFLAQKYDAQPAITKVIKYEYFDWNRNTSSKKPIDTRYMIENYNRAEVLSDIGLVAPTAEMATLLADKPGMPVYIYYLQNYVSYHSVELNYVFGVPFIGGNVDELDMFNEQERVPEDKTRSVEFMKIWTNFAKSGQPKLEEISATTWNATDAGSLDYLHVVAERTAATSFTIMPNLFAHKVGLWNVLIPDMLTNSTRGEQGFHHNKTWIFFGFTIALLALVVVLLCIIVWASRKGGNRKHPTPEVEYVKLKDY